MSGFFRNLSKIMSFSMHGRAGWSGCGVTILKKLPRVFLSKCEVFQRKVEGGMGQRTPMEFASEPGNRIRELQILTDCSDCVAGEPGKGDPLTLTCSEGNPMYMQVLLTRTFPPTWGTLTRSFACPWPLF